ncbi:MAG: DsbA family protein [Patescibacteria group bacterium]|nr:DsbA family protein [Patescibacteria group bacterium]
MAVKRASGGRELAKIPVLLVASIGLSFFVGILWQKVNYLESGKVAGTQNATGTTAGTQKQAQDNPSVTIEQIKDLFKKDLIKFGDEGEKLLFVEVADPSCPYCHVAAGLNPELNAQMGDRFKLTSDGGSYLAPVPEMRKLVDAGKASYIYIYQNGHGNGEMGQKALYCAFEKGKFWQVHDLLMTNAGYNLLNNTVKNDKAQAQALADFLKSAVSSSELKACLESGKYDKRLTEDVSLANSLGVGGTPGFFINTQNFAGAFGWTDMKSVADSALQ